MKGSIFLMIHAFAVPLVAAGDSDDAGSDVYEP